MNRTLWKLDRIGQRLRNLATLTAIQAIALANEGKGIAVVADETRNLANKVNDVVEKAMFEEDIDKDKIMPLALELNFLALNCAIESSRIIGFAGKRAAVCADEIRGLAYEIVCLFDEASAMKNKQAVSPWASNPSSAARNGEFLLLNAGGINFVEPLVNIKEVCGPFLERRDDHVILRSMELPLVDVYKMLDETKEEPTHVILWTPWAEQNKTYAVTSDVSFIFFSPIGKPIDVPAEMPLAKYVRECWENENGEPFYFMNWTMMVQ